MIQTYMLHIFDIVVLYDSIHLFTLMQNKTIIVSCVPNVASFSFLIALLIFSISVSQIMRSIQTAINPY
jgi:hypothetical protein